MRYNMWGTRFSALKIHVTIFVPTSEADARLTSDVSKFAHVMGALDGSAVADLMHAIRAAPAYGKYAHLRAAILAEFSLSPDRQLQKLLNEMQLGSQRPSQLLHKMQALAPD